MSIILDLKEQLAQSLTLKDVSSAFTDVNAVKIKKLKADFEKNRRFYEEITSIYHSVKVSAARHEYRLDLEKRGHKKGGQTESGPAIRVALTSNSHFFGELNVNVIRKFNEDCQKSDDDCLVIGQTGQDLMRPVNKKLKLRFLDLAKDYPAQQETLDFIEKTRKYERVLLYYPKFLSVLSQSVGVLDMAQAAEAETVKGKIEYIYEPELTKIVEFFENQMRTLLFIRCFLETELSRTAARLISMNAASARAAEFIRMSRVQLKKIDSSLRNTRLLETFSGLDLWSN